MPPHAPPPAQAANQQPWLFHILPHTTTSPGCSSPCYKQQRNSPPLLCLASICSGRHETPPTAHPIWPTAPSPALPLPLPFSAHVNAAHTDCSQQNTGEQRTLSGVNGLRQGGAGPCTFSVHAVQQAAKEALGGRQLRGHDGPAGRREDQHRAVLLNIWVCLLLHCWRCCCCALAVLELALCSSTTSGTHAMGHMHACRLLPQSATR